ncbi:MAG TPA: acetate--CoA ligase [Myxococcales bacterium]|nr:acetate--CoA ligase [Myxococcales bacterium]
MAQPQSSILDTVESESRLFPPPAHFAERARIGNLEEYRALHRRSLDDPEGFWREQATALTWSKPFDRVLEWQAPHAQWFVGGQLNASVNCLDRHVAAGHGGKVALIWEGEPFGLQKPGEERVFTYAELLAEVCRFANALRAMKVRTGDRVGIYLPLVPEAVIAMLACARLGATHSVVFGGFSAEALRDRMADAGAKVIVTSDGGYRRGAVVPLKKNVDAAVTGLAHVQQVIVVRRTGENVPMKPGRDIYWDEAVRGQPATCEPTPLDSEHALFILYTSGTTGKPKGVVHATAGYLLQTALSMRWVFDLKDEDVYWCTADVGWITGHSYVTYGPLAERATILLYEGAPNWPEPDRIWDIIERRRVSILYTAPTAIRSFIKAGDEHPEKHDLSSLRLLGTVGEPINPEAWMWYHRVIGKERCPIVDTWWQTETGAIAVAPLPGATPTKPGSATFPLPGMSLAVVDAEGKPVPKGNGGSLVIDRPWPAMLRTVHNDPKRYAQQYWSQFPGKYFTGDGARFDADGYLWVMGRIDDVINVSGHRLGTAEIESALVTHPSVAEAAVVGRPDDMKGTAVAAFVTLKAGRKVTNTLKDELRNHVVKHIGALARPDDIRFADALPKTRSGKIMRRLLRDVAAGRQAGDTTTLEDLAVLAALQKEED